ncbi:globin domain-containing protein [Lacibacter sp.]|uniref:globin domain-containing protein n=1 Tax=Lacibacter sp. TaxID=1915409 RepID=UPI002B4B446D|nr:globin domain-containing protein [Lacibacter sp.]HLP36442.1 globin domain-containing protein [Lacibacter sp.]
MTKEEIILIKRTWKLFREINPAVVGDTFYSKLFLDNPSVRKMFPKEMNQQYQKLIDMLSIVVGRLDNLDELSSDIAAMAQRHVAYGVKPAQYKKVGEALLWTLEQGLGKDFTPEVKEAWTKCYTTLADTMIKASAN